MTLNIIFLQLLPKHLEVKCSFLSLKAAWKNNSKLSQCLHLELNVEA